MFLRAYCHWWVQSLREYKSKDGCICRSQSNFTQVRTYRSVATYYCPSLMLTNRRLKPKIIEFLVVAFGYSHNIKEKAQTGWLGGVSIMCPSGPTCLSAECCFNELALCKSNSTCWSRTKLTSSSSHWKLTCSCHNIAEKLLNWC